MGCFNSKPSGARPVNQDDRFRAIRDQFETVEEVQGALRKNGLESSQLIVGVDFTKSNEWTGKESFHGQSLHFVGGPWPSPYEQAATAIGRTLAAFDDDHKIPCYGFGDVTTGDSNVFSFFEGGRPANGLAEMVARYRQLAQHVDLSGPTSFAPLINQAMRLVIQDKLQYHILLLLADGQVQAGRQQRETIDAIVAASYLPLSIVMIGLGDGPWADMKAFDDQLPQRRFDNFQFVCWNDVVRESPGLEASRLEAAFALRALMEVPEQYKAVVRLGMLGGPPPNIRISQAAPLPPPPRVPPPPPTGLAAPPAAASAGNNSTYPPVHAGAVPLPSAPPPPYP